MDKTGTPLSEKRRTELIDLLERRGELLAPSADLVETTLARIGAMDDEVSAEEQEDEGAAAVVPSSAKPGASGPLPGTGALDQAPGTGPIDAAAAGAATVPESVEDHAAERVRLREVTGRDESAWTKKKATTKMLKIGAELGGYRIDGILGVGGMGQVYQATQLSMNRAVAFKVLSPRLARNQAFRERFFREARNAGRLQHSNLIAVHDVGEARGLLFFSMERVQGYSVADILKETGALDEDRAREIAGQVLEALKYAHDNGVIHRDIKPDNIMVTDEGVVKVADLGLSRDDARRGDASSTQAGSLMGTPYYMPPEQGRNARGVDHRADIYAVGATLYHMVCGQVPFAGNTAVEVVMNASSQPLTFPASGPSPAMRRVIARMMAKDPEERPQSAAEALRLVLGKFGTLQHSSRMFGERSGYQPGTARRRRLVTTVVTSLLVAAVIVAVGVGLVLYTRAQAWNRVQEQLTGAVAAGDYLAGQQLIEDYAAAHPGQRQQIATLEEGFTRAWNEGTLDALSARFDEIDSALLAADYPRARQVLERIGNEPANLSPAVRARLAGLRERVVTQELQALVGMVVLEPPTAVQRLGSGHYRLRGSGEGRIPVPTPMPRGVDLVARIRIAGDGQLAFDHRDGDMVYRLAIGAEEQTVHCHPAVRGGARRRSELARHRHGGTATLRLHRHPRGATLDVPGWDDHLQLDADQADAGYAFIWELADGSAEVEFAIEE